MEVEAGGEGRGEGRGEGKGEDGGVSRVGGGGGETKVEAAPAEVVAVDDGDGSGGSGGAAEGGEGGEGGGSRQWAVPKEYVFLRSSLCVCEI
jgi:hypothetical protein